MNIVAVNDGHNASAVLMTGGRIVGALQEERLTRVKNQSGFPERALDHLLRDHGLRYADVDDFIFCSTWLPGTPTADRGERIRRYRKSYTPAYAARHLAKRLGVKRIVGPVTRGRRRRRLERAGVEPGRISFMDHHTCHAASAYFGQPERDEPVLVLTNDGAGDDLAATVRASRGGEMKLVASTSMEASIGEVWAVVTALMGMAPLEHEHKLMGLAPYAPGGPAERVRDVFAGMFEFTGDGLSWRMRAGAPAAPMAYNYLRRKLEFMRFDWIAAGLQRFTEEFLGQWAANCVAATGLRRLALAGGTFMNVKVNQRIMEMPEVDSLYVVPSCGDETNPVGAVYRRHFRATGRWPEPLTHLYLGTRWSDEDVRTAFDAYPFVKTARIERADDIAERTAALLAEGEVVAWFQGREEFGARALGARSLLADPMRPGIVRRINAMIKSRDFWMPFAASMLDDVADRYCRNPKGVAAPWMVLTFDTRNTGEIAAGVHPEDGTCRPQVVYESWNPRFHRLLEAFRARTGRGAVLNTSFNLHGLPIASAPRDAFQVLDDSGLGHLAIGDWLVSATG